MYDADYFFVENGLGRYSLGSRDELKFNGDGSLDLYIQRHPPGQAGSPTGCPRRRRSSS